MLLMADLYGARFRDQTDVCWIGLYTFCRDTIGGKYPAEASSDLDVWSDVVRSCGWWWPFEGLCIVCERPERIEWVFDPLPRRELTERWPALLYRDGFRVVHGGR
jgi:hypothetical protein